MILIIGIAMLVSAILIGIGFYSLAEYKRQPFVPIVMFTLALITIGLSLAVFSNIAEESKTEGYCIALGYTSFILTEENETYCVRYGDEPAIVKKE
jgi:uncharacterized membrane protein (UPF0136 family)